MNKIKLSKVIQWLLSRIAVIYLVLFLFCITCIDLKTVETRIKVRHLNDSIPDFADMIVFSKSQNAKQDIDWQYLKSYFELILRYIPDDVTTRQLLGYVNFYMGQEKKSITLLKSTSVINKSYFFWPNYNLGVIYYRKGMWSDAGEYLFNAISSNSKLSLFLMQNSMVYKQIFANPYFKYSLSDEMNDAQAQAYILLLSSLNNMRQYEKMIVVSNLAIENDKLPHKDAFYFY